MEKQDNDRIAIGFGFEFDLESGKIGGNFGVEFRGQPARDIGAGIEDLLGILNPSAQIDSFFTGQEDF